MQQKLLLFGFKARPLRFHQLININSCFKEHKCAMVWYHIIFSNEEEIWTKREDEFCSKYSPVCHQTFSVMQLQRDQLRQRLSREGLCSKIRFVAKVDKVTLSLNQRHRHIESFQYFHFCPLCTWVSQSYVWVMEDSKNMSSTWTWLMIWPTRRHVTRLKHIHNYTRELSRDDWKFDATLELGKSPIHTDQTEAASQNGPLVYLMVPY